MEFRYEVITADDNLHERVYDLTGQVDYLDLEHFDLPPSDHLILPFHLRLILLIRLMQGWVCTTN